MNLVNAFIEILKSAARIASPTSFSLKDNHHQACVLIIDVTAVDATPSMVVTIYGVDPLSGKKFVILASAAIATVSTTVLKVGPGMTAAANAVANDRLPKNIEIEFLQADADSITYTAGLHLMPG